MAKRARDAIPSEILAAAKAVGLRSPLWYVGRTNGHKPAADEPRVGDLMRQASHVPKKPGVVPTSRTARTPRHQGP